MVIIDPARCTGCGQCAQNCAVHAIVREEIRGRRVSNSWSSTVKPTDWLLELVGAQRPASSSSSSSSRVTFSPVNCRMPSPPSPPLTARWPSPTWS